MIEARHVTSLQRSQEAYSCMKSIPHRFGAKIRGEVSLHWFVGALPAADLARASGVAGGGGGLDLDSLGHREHLTLVLLLL